MSNDQKEAKLKASPADFVWPLLKRLELAKEQVPKNSEKEEVINQISTDIVNTKDIIDGRGNWDTELIGYFGEIERQIDYWVDHNKMTEWDGTVRANLINVRDQLQNLIVNPPKAGTKPREKASDLSQKATITEVGESSNKGYQEHEYSKDKKIPMTYLRSFLNSLVIFPENTELKKRFLIYWWTGLRLLTSRQCKGYTSIEEYCEYVFSELVHKGVLIPVHIREHNQVVDSCTIEPAIHKRLISAWERNYWLISQKTEEGTWHLYGSQQWKSGLLNLNQRFLNSKNIMDISSQNHLSAVQLGSWGYTKTEVHNGVEEEHIEVDETDFLKQLGETVTYLSLRGISRIEELHESIGKLENLIILDLRSCHNLENLSQKPRSIFEPKLIRRVLPRENMFKNLMVLDISECYLLDIMPKWICELHNLEVLKGFVVGSMGDKNPSCQLGDLSNLANLRKLSIRIGSKHLASEDLSGLRPLNKLLVLTIIWGENNSNYAMPTLFFPKNLEKLDIRCYPGAEASKLLNTAKLKNLRRLYISGGKLTEIPYSDNWEVEILRLKFLPNLEADWDELKRSFKNLKYVEYVECPRLKNFPKDKCRWIKEEDQKATITEVGESSNKGYQEHECFMDKKIPVTYVKSFLDSLAIFPENTELKKRFLIYWWTGLRLLTSRQCKGYTSIEEYCEYVFSELVHEGILIPVHIREHNQVVDSYTIEPAIHKRLISAGERDELISPKRDEGTWHLYGSRQWKSGLLNLGQRYLNSKDIIMDISSQNHLSAVQLGSWRYTKTEVHNGVEEEHIEVDETDFLKQLGETVTYLSLRGISRIEELHESIGKLENLIILDLRSCHNLEYLSQKPRSTMKPKLIRRVLPRENMFKNLMVLDISECYLLDIMPKWICELYNLEVLKGFVVGSMGNQSCQLADLSNLTHLRKLSIRIGSKHLASEDLSGLKSLNKLLVLTIIWGENKSNNAMPTSFPENLEKLDIRCYPEAEASKLLIAENLKNLKRLYIRGGKLTEIPYSDNWEVEILRLKFLRNLETNWNELRPSFKNLQYVEYVECPKLKNFPKDKCCWIKKKDEHFQSDNETVNQS